MPKKPETLFREKVRRRLDALPHSFWESIQQRCILGTPDILGCIKGKLIGLELKSEGGKLSRLQELKLSLIAKAGGIGIVIDPSNWDTVFEMLEELSK